MWKYEQNSGTMIDPDGNVLATGYSGEWDGSLPIGGPNDHRNKPTDENIKATGPIPTGTYTIEDATNNTNKGPIAMHLTPDANNEMFGRSAFMIHGDLSPPRSGRASEGCIILNRVARTAIDDSDDRVLIVE